MSGAWILLIGASLNVHYLLLGRTAAECLAGNAWVVGAANSVFAAFVSAAMTRAGVPGPNATIEYADAGGRRLLLDVYEPSPQQQQQSGKKKKKKGKRPACVYFHAGAWVTGSRALGAAPLTFLAERGVVGFSPTYRLASTVNSAGLAGAVQDAKAAVDWVAAHADEYDIDTTRLFVMGDSAGALLALDACLARQRGVSKCAAVVLGWPALSVRPHDWVPKQPETTNVFVPDDVDDPASYARDHVLAGQFLLFGRRRRGWLPARFDAAQADALSPLPEVFLDGRRKKLTFLPPAYVAAAPNDTVVPFSQVETLRDAYVDAASTLTLATFRSDADHGDGHYYARAGRAELLDFLDRLNLLGEKANGKSKALEEADSPALDALADLVGAKTDFAPPPSDDDVAASKKEGRRRRKKPDKTVREVVLV